MNSAYSNETDLLLKLLDGLFGELCPGLGLLQLGGEGLYLLLVVGLPLVRFLLRHLSNAKLCRIPSHCKVGDEGTGEISNLAYKSIGCWP
jgi:hypothetical protein